MRRILLSAGAAIAFSVMASAGAGAATFSECATGTLKMVGSAYDCTISDNFDQDFLNADPLTVNMSPGFFDVTDWMFVGKDEKGKMEGQSGTFDFTAAVEALSYSVGKLMLVFKDGRGTTLVGFLVTKTADMWQSPFTADNFPDAPGIDGGPKDVSHISLYAQEGEPPVVPLPAAGWLLLAGVGGLVAMRRKRKDA